MVEIQPAYLETAYRVSIFGDDVEAITHFAPLTGEVYAKLDHITVEHGFRLPSALDNRPLRFDVTRRWTRWSGFSEYAGKLRDEIKELRRELVALAEAGRRRSCRRSAARRGT